MAERRIDAFFYGLFMDRDVLRGYGVTVTESCRAHVDGHTLVIGRRATLVPRSGARAYGMLIAVTFEDLDRLYGAPGLEAYAPEAVLAQIEGGDTRPALCYNLRDAPRPDEANAEYAGRLREVLSRLGFPAEYVASVR